MSEGRARSPWTPAEDRALFEVVSNFGAKNWVTIAKHIPKRSAKQCRERWRNHVNPGIRKGHWTKDEDSIIIASVQKWGFRWALIAGQLSGRTGSSIKNRFHGCLKQKYGLLDFKPEDAGGMDMDDADSDENLEKECLELLTQSVNSRNELDSPISTDTLSAFSTSSEDSLSNEPQITELSPELPIYRGIAISELLCD
eukprot:c685_g1_i1.p1 GENE.c685_g1_i1~~c685_g1_i1.p1  ORF type:complete len:210 (+),score=19.13 c685_g1_i1:37-630(+)